MTESNHFDPSQASAANLAYMGDCVYELYVREYLVRRNTSRPSVESLKYVTAPVQSRVLERILPLLTEEEDAQFRRGRNLGHSSIPKAASPGEYRRATGLEALFGWLYLSGRNERIRELFDAAFAAEEVREAPAETDPEAPAAETRTEE